MNKKVSLHDIFMILKKNIMLMLVLTGIGAAVAYLVSDRLMTPLYQSTTQLLVSHTPDAVNGIQLNDINTNIQMINTYKDIIEGPVVLDEVFTQIDGKYTVGQLQSMIELSSNDQSQVFSIHVTAPSAADAAMIANQISQTFQESAVEMMSVDNVSVISAATPNTRPVSPNILRNVLIGIVAGLLLGFLIPLVRFLFDVTANKEYIEESYQWANLGNISLMEEKEWKILAGVTPFPQTHEEQSKEVSAWPESHAKIEDMKTIR